MVGDHRAATRGDVRRRRMSGTTNPLQRPGFPLVTRGEQGGTTAVVIDDLARFARDPEHVRATAKGLQQHDVALYLATDERVEPSFFNPAAYRQQLRRPSPGRAQSGKLRAG